MAIWKKLSGELIDIIEWLDDTRDTMVWRYPRYDNEIKNGAKLIVRESQACAFINEGTIADVFEFPGTYTLETRNLPILSKLRGWKYGFESPFKAEVYFVSLRTFTDRRWGTKNPVMMRDPEFGPVRLRAFGTFALRVLQVGTFLKNVVGTNHRFSIDQIGEQLRDLMVARFADAVAESGIPVLDMAARQDELGKVLLSRINPDFAQFGLEVVQLVVENISLPPEVEKALDKRTSVGVAGDLGKYTQYQSAEAIREAAQNPGGVAGIGAGMGAGIAMANQMGQALAQGGAGGSGAAPPPLPTQQVMYFLAINNQQVGPFDLAGVASQIQAGRVTRSTLVWKHGMSGWSEAGNVQELAGLFPPPLPQ
ncbi:MAG: SPFH domain-containing protein [Phycisphaerae bacterium]|nr:SPFH domain-containing protein [Phycisphaerae bacterium]MDW8262524.1 SPFH domain-containing protein [Phycisphaerales bacterium]